MAYTLQGINKNMGNSLVTGNTSARNQYLGNNILNTKINTPMAARDLSGLGLTTTRNPFATPQVNSGLTSNGKNIKVDDPSVIQVQNVSSNSGATGTKKPVITPAVKNPILNTDPAKEYMQNLQGGGLASNGYVAPEAPRIAGISVTADESPAPSAPTNNPYSPTEAYTQAYKDYQTALGQNSGVSSAQNAYNDYVANQSKSISGLEGQGRGIPLNLIRGEQAKLLNQTNPEATRLQNAITIAQGGQANTVNQAKAGLDYQTNLMDRAQNNIPVSAKEYEYAKSNGYKGTFSEYQNEDANRKSVATGIGTDANSVAQGIISGIIPPDLTKNVSFKDRTAVNAILAKSGYNLTDATQDWTATQKYLSTLNGAQQTRLRQAVNFADGSLDMIPQLSENFKRSGVAILNKAQLAAAKQGLLGQAAQSAAVQLDSQISDLISELATVYKGGNSSTDESLKLAAKQLDSNWSEKTLLDAISLIKKNIQIRKNSIANTGVGGIDATSNAYNPSSGSSDPLGLGI